MKKLILTQEQFFLHLQKLIASGVTFEAEENDNGFIEINFLGGY